MFCGDCGFNYPDDSRLCPQCGQSVRLEKTSEPCQRKGKSDSECTDNPASTQFLRCPKCGSRLIDKNDYKKKLKTILSNPQVSRRFASAKIQFIMNICVFLAVMVVCILFLLLASCIPQTVIKQNLIESLPQLQSEGIYPHVFESDPTSILDNFTEAQMLAQAYSMNTSDLSAIFTNPKLALEDGTYIDALEKLVEEDMEPNVSYARYWMGFRATLRIMLCFFNLMQLRRIICTVFFMLVFAVIISLSKRLGTLYASAFAVSMLFISPEIICSSMQYTCCFLIGLTAMLLVPHILKRTENFVPFFIITGILTMYFDFYSTPVITLCLPLIYLLLLSSRPKESKNVSALTYAGVWFTGYVLMWVMKLTLTTVLTDVNGFTNGFTAFASRVGINRIDEYDWAYNPLLALYDVFLAVCDDIAGMVLFVLFFVVLLTAWYFILKKNKYTVKNTFSLIKENSWLIWVFFMPVIWYMVAAQPTCIHYCFQYRSVIVCLFAFFVMLIKATPHNSQQKL